MSVLKEHLRANQILDLRPDRREEAFTRLAQQEAAAFVADVRNLVKVAGLAARDHRHFGWRVNWLNQKRGGDHDAV